MAIFARLNLQAVTCLSLSLALGACAQSTTKPEVTSAAAATPPGNQTPTTPAAADAPATAPAAPKALIAKSPDGTRIAYEKSGNGPALLLLHGGGQTRRSWDQLGYIDRLAKRFTVIAMDLRGVGDSDKPVTPEAYTLDALMADALAVADAADAKTFHIYGFGHGGTIARYLAARSDRVTSAVLVGMTLGPPATGVFKAAVEAMRSKWQPMITAQTAGTLDVKTLSASDRTAWEGGIGTNVAMLSAMLDYPALEPADIKVPTLWAVGSDDSAVENLKEYEPKLKGTQVTGRVLSSVNYSDSFIKMEQVLDEIEPFWKTVISTTN